MTKLSTAEEYLDKYVIKADSFYTEEHEKAMIEFAKFHVKRALDSASKIKLKKIEWIPYVLGQPDPEVDIQSILNAYPESNIK